MTIPTPILTLNGKVRSDWIDENDHMNVAFYLKAFDDAFYDVFPVWTTQTFSAAMQTGYGQFVAQANVKYLREMTLGEPFTIETQLLDHDRKRLYWFLRMKKSDATVAATCEMLCLVVSLRERRVSEMPEEWFARAGLIRQAHSVLEQPAEHERCLSLLRKTQNNG